ncbi:MAG TPA: helicase-related protein [Smithellaceae bacterium]|nr:helicase-related protein [Smithellaceae bacterium]
MLRDAARLSTRAAAGPFRSFGRIAAEPRPYQLVPLMMALRLDPVRLLIADDVGIGKTIEAALIARELLDRGEINSFTVLCPPHLAEQWQRELSQKFHIDAELVLAETIHRLENDLPVGVSIFDRHRFTVVSTDFIKSSRRADDFIIKCPKLVIVDEAHGCTLAEGVGRGRQQRFDLLKRITEDDDRHLILVTATPHSGKEEAFRSLLSLLRDEFANLPTDLDREERADIRRKLARHLVQRRRADLRHYLDADTSFPERYDKNPEPTYTFSKEYKQLFDDILSFAREYVSEDGTSRRNQRVRYWSALALLRCVSSSPAAAAATLRSRAAVDEAADIEIDEVGRRTVLDQDDTDDVAVIDFSPGSDDETSATNTRRKLLEFARRAESIPTEADRKLQGAIKEIKELLKEKFHPIVFCRFVDTADYVANHLREALGEKIRVQSVTGLLPPAEREARIESLVSESEKYVLVCTDCLAEGVNLQNDFNAVLHYDLAWNPTRHEQREGRVDRFGQKSLQVRVTTYYGTDNPIDGVILDVLIRKHKRIKSDLGVTVAVPGSSEQIAEALFEGALFREKTHAHPDQLRLDFIDEMETKKKDLHVQWDNARDREKASRSRFAQHAINPEEVAQELASVRAAIGRSEDVSRFFSDVLQLTGVPFDQKANAVRVHVSSETPRALRQAIGFDDPFAGRFELPLGEKEIYLARTSPVIEGLANWVLDQALDPVARDGRPIAARLGVISTSAVHERTTLFVIRFRYHLEKAGTDEAILCEEVVPLACTGPQDNPTWLPQDESEKLLSARPERNLIATAINQQTGLLQELLPAFRQSLEIVAKERADIQLAAHERVRAALKTKTRMAIKPVLPADILGAYVVLPRLI